MLKLTAANELVALENMSVVQQSGFEVTLEDQSAGRRPMLVVQPVSRMPSLTSTERLAPIVTT